MEFFKRIKRLLLKSKINKAQKTLKSLESTSVTLHQYQNIFYKDKPDLLKYLSEEGESITSLKIEDLNLVKSPSLPALYDNLQISWTDLLMYLAMVPNFENLNQEILGKMILQVHKDLVQFNQELSISIQRDFYE